MSSYYAAFIGGCITYITLPVVSPPPLL